MLFIVLEDVGIISFLMGEREKRGQEIILFWKYASDIGEEGRDIPFLK